jgi:cytidylate kinase
VSTAAPLVVPEGAVHLDTTPYGLDEVVALVVDIVEQTMSQVTTQRASS